MIKKHISLFMVLALAILLICASPVMAGPGDPDITDIPSTVIKPITLTVPHGGEVWQGGIERTITWKYIPSLFKANKVQILLLKGDNVVDTIASSVPVGTNGQGSFKWSTLNVAPGTDYRIKIIGIASATVSPALDKNAQSDTSGLFTISEKAKITITFPAGNGQTLIHGQHVNITWNYTGDIGNTLYLRLVHSSDPPNGGLFSVLIDPKAPAGNGGHGSYQWVIPNNLPVSATYFFDIGCEYAGIGASGKSFKIDSLKVKIIDKNLTPPANIHLPNPGQIVELNPQPEPPSQ